MTALRVGSLCSGYGGLEMGAALALGPLDHRWHAEYDQHAAAVLARHWPDVPNLGDIAAVTADDAWADQPPVDVILAGYPCQGESNAGLRKGSDDPRFRWPDVHAAVRALRPPLVILENVRGHLNRSFPRVVAEMAGIGYVGRWRCVRASDAGAAHRRERLFVVAWPQELHAPELPGHPVAADTARLSLLPTPTAARTGFNRGGAAGRVGPERPSLDLIHALLPTPTTSDGTGGPGASGRDGGLNLRTAVTLLPNPDAWGVYAPAVERWEAVTGRAAPSPTEPGRGGKPRLSPVFVEWLMGLPEGHVTAVVDNRSHALRILGNGVVPQAAALALHRLLAAPAQLDLFGVAA